MNDDKVNVIRIIIMSDKSDAPTNERNIKGMQNYKIGQYRSITF